MPVIAVADQVGLKTAAGVLVVIAVFTTLVSALDILTESVRDAFARLAVSPSLSEAESTHFPALRARIGRFAEAFSSPSRRTAAVFVCLAALYPVSFLGFETIVDALYPFVGLCGVAMTVLTALSLAKKLIKKPRYAGRVSDASPAIAVVVVAIAVRVVALIVVIVRSLCKKILEGGTAAVRIGVVQPFEITLR